MHFNGLVSNKSRRTTVVGTVYTEQETGDDYESAVIGLSVRVRGGRHKQAHASKVHFPLAAAEYKRVRRRLQVRRVRVVFVIKPLRDGFHLFQPDLRRIKFFSTFDLDDYLPGGFI